MMHIRLERRSASSRASRWAGFGVAVVAALCVGGAVFMLAGANAIAAYAAMAGGVFGSPDDLAEVVVKAIPLVLCGLAVAIAAKIRLWNVGAEGQLVLGGIGAAAVGLFLAPRLPAPAVVPLMLVAAFLAGGLWALLAGLLWVKSDVNEILTTLMLNYVAILWLEHLYFGPWRDPMGMGFPGTAMFPDAARLPRFLGTRVHLGVVLGVAAAVAIHAALSRTRWGYEMRVIGESAKVAQYAGLPITRTILWVMSLSGGLAGLAGMAEASGIHYRLQQGLAVGYGYTGIIVAALARFHPGGVILAALFIAGILVGGDQLQTVMHLPSSVGLVLESTLLFCVLGSDFFSQYRICRRSPTP